MGAPITMGGCSDVFLLLPPPPPPPPVYDVDDDGIEERVGT